jgi:O-antigen ligase
MAILDGSLILVEFARNPGPKIHSSVYIFLVPAALFFFKNRPILKLFSLILFIAAALASGKRGTLLAAIISLALATGIIYSRDLFSGRTLVFRRSHLLRAAFLSVITGLSLILLDAVIPKESVLFRQSLQLLNNIASIFNDYVLHDEVDGSYQSRINEWLNVKEFYQRSPELILFGGGLGAEIDMIHDSSVYSDSGRMHHVHIGWIAYFLRNGLLGIILLLGYFGANMLIALKGMKSGIDRSFPSALLFITLFELFLSAKSSLMFQIFYPYTAILAGICIFKIYTNRTTSIAPQKLLSPAALLNREIIDSLSSKANTNRIRSTRSLPHSNA